MKLKIIKYEVHLEGFEIPGVVSTNISENKNSLPTASISIVGNKNTFRLLGGTIVNIFGNIDNESPEDMRLLFEGKIGNITYHDSSDGNESFSIGCVSLISEIHDTTVRPSDSVVTKSEAAATNVDNIILWAPKGKLEKSINSPMNSVSGLSSLVKNLNVTFAKLLKSDSPGGSGNFFPMFKDFDDLYVRSNILYAINSKSFNIFDTLFIAPNPGLNQYFKSKATKEALLSPLNVTLGVDHSEISLSTIYNTFKSYFYYTSIAPAAPTIFEANNEKNANNFIREYYIPDITSGPPVLTNIVFPKNLLSINFSEDLLGEITRVVVNAGMNLTKNGDLTNLDIVTVAPIDLPVYNYANIRLLGYSKEEVLKGVKIQRLRVNKVMNDILTKEYKDNDNSLITASNDLTNDSNQASKELKSTASVAYLNGKYSRRVVNIIVEYNQKYIIGLPGMIFRKGMPTIIGMVSSINHNISSSGSSHTSISFSNCRLIYDEDEIYNNNTNSEDSQKERPANPLKDYLLSVNENIDIIGGIDYIFNKDLYSFDNIGKFLYRYMVEGIFDYSILNELVTKPNFSDYNIYKKDASSKSKDFSVLRFAPEGIIYNSKFNKVEQFGYKLALSIKQLKDKYYNLDDKNKDIFISTILKRSIISKEDYLSSIGGNNSAPFELNSDTKDLYRIINKVLSGNLEGLKEKILKLNIPKTIEEQITNLKKSIKTSSDELNKIQKEIQNPDITTSINPLSDRTAALKNIAGELRSVITKKITDLDKLKKTVMNPIKEDEDIMKIFYPYNKTRKAHVFEAFLSFIDTAKLKIKDN